MSVRNLEKVFRPKSVAVIGASEREGAVGRTVIENLVAGEFEGAVFPVNPKRATVLGLEAYPSVAELPTTPDLAIVCTPAPTTPGLVRQCGEAGVLGLVVLTAGFREMGDVGRAAEKELAAAKASFPDMRMIGPNCLGVIAPGSGLNASFAAAMPSPGRVAFLSQSGALCTSILDWSLEENLGFSAFVSVGNAVDTNIGDLIDYFAEDPDTESIVLYVESVTNARRFMSAGRAFTRSKPIVVYKAGRYAESAKAAASHTGALAGVDAVYDAAFQRAGMVRVHDAADMFDCAELLARGKAPRGPRLAIVTNAGGPGVMAVDELLTRHGKLAELQPGTLAALDSFLPPHWSHGNPVDVLGDAEADRYAQALRAVSEDENVDASLVILTPQAMTDPTAAAQAVVGAAAASRKPILAAWMGGPAVRDGRRVLTDAGVATYESPDRAIRAFAYLTAYRRNRELLYETPQEVCATGSTNHEVARAVLAESAERGDTTLTEVDSKRLLGAYGVGVTTPWLAPTADVAVVEAHQIGYPVVMKIHSPQITHKSEVGVVTGLSSDNAVREAFDRVTKRARKMYPDAQIDGVTLQKMADTDGVELIVGAKRDPIFGPVMMVGAGGVTAEVLMDRVLELPPLNERLAFHMLRALRIWPLIKGYRGKPGVDLVQLIEALMHVSYLVVDHPEIAELDVNPLIASPEGVVALDARVILSDDSAADAAPLAVCPYPQKLVRETELSDGTRVVLRPIRPEDEPAWRGMMEACSAAGVWEQFRHVFHNTSHDLATRYCFVDYDRTMAIVAELKPDDDHRGPADLLGVGRLSADSDHLAADYAVLVRDAWRGRGLGSLLTDYCMEIAGEWGIGRVSVRAPESSDAMRAMAAKRGFDLTGKAGENDVVYQRSLVAEGV